MLPPQPCMHRSADTCMPQKVNILQGAYCNPPKQYCHFSNNDPNCSYKANRFLGPYSQHLLHSTGLERLARDILSSLLGPFVSYTENCVVKMAPIAWAKSLFVGIMNPAILLVTCVGCLGLLAEYYLCWYNHQLIRSGSNLSAIYL